MAGDVLNHQPVAASTAVPGSWLIDLASDPVIHVKRFQIADTEQSTFEKRDDSLEKAWRAINSSGGSDVRSVLSEACAVICSGQGMKGIDNGQSRELWVFQARQASEGWDQSIADLVSGLAQPASPDPAPITPSQTLTCPRHGHDVSCLLRPSTSQRPLKSCDVRFDPQGNDKIIWARLTEAIAEKSQWKRGKRLYVRREKNLRIRLYPTATGLLLRVKTVTPALTPFRRIDASKGDGTTMVVLDPLGLPAILIGPYRATEAEEGILTTSYETSLGPGWREGQSVAKVRAQLDDRSYDPFSALWVPCGDIASTGGSSDIPLETAKNGQGVLTIWPTHLLSAHGPLANRSVRPSSIPSPPVSDSHIDLMGAASGLFESMSAYREPVPEITPPSDHSLEEPVLDDAGSMHETATPIPGGSPTEKTGDDDLEDLFASNTPARSPEPFDSAQPFDMFGDREDRRLSFGNNNAHLIDYDDVVMSSPPAQEERRESLRQVMSRQEAIEEPDPAFVTEDDFNFFDSPNDDVADPDENLVTSLPDDELQVSPAKEAGLGELQAAIDTEQKSDPPIEAIATPAEDNKPHSQHAESSKSEPEVAPIGRVSEPPAVPSIPDAAQTEVPTAIQPTIANRQNAKQDFVPSAFEPLELNSGTTFTYSLPSPAPTPQNLNLDLVERLNSPKATKQAYDYASAWLLDVPISEADEDEYTGPPTPVSLQDEDDESTAGPTPTVTTKAGSGELEYDGVPCITTDWFALIENSTKIEQLSRPWNPSWSGAPLSTTATKKEKQAGYLSKKRKRHVDVARDGDDINLGAFAMQVVVNRDLRRSLTRHIDDDFLAPSGSADELSTRGVALADFIESDPESEEGEENERKQRGPSALSQCAIHVGFRGNIVRLNIAALRYWRELDLQPLSGSKNFKAVVIHHQIGGGAVMRHRFERLRNVYQSLSLGECDLDNSFGKDGLLNASAKKDALVQAVAWAEKQEANAAIIVICDPDKHSQLAAYLDQKRTSTLKPVQIIQLIPSTSFAHREIQDLARSLYDRFPRQLRTAHPAANEDPPFYKFPAFTLCPDLPPKPQLTLQWPMKSLDIFGSWRWVHAAYATSLDGRSVAIMMSDAEGEDWQIKILRAIQPDNWSEKVSTIWDCLRGFASTAAIEWRLSVCRLGLMSKAEIDAWRQLYVTITDPLSIMMSEASSDPGLIIPRNGPPNAQPGLINDPTTVVVDESLAGSHFALPLRQPVVIEGTTIYPESSFLLSTATPTLEHDTSTVHLLFHRPAPGKDDEEAEMVLAKELYRIGCWSRVKFGLHGLPGHLAAVRAVVDSMASLNGDGAQS